ncbi:MAG: DUF3987 domain-containing protein [Deltaproteobacteria bacterium]|nr:DUF3987 domain-containing protein [Deltaproteobacteria bacterium]
MNQSELERQLRTELQGSSNWRERVQGGARQTPQPAPSWPTLNPLALYGLAGDTVKTIDLYTEADPVAVLVTFLIFFGSVIGRKAHVKVEFTHHYLNLFASLVGDSSKGRKGVSRSTAHYIFSRVDSDWANDRNTSGLSSGEGLIHAVRDQTIQSQPIKKDGRVIEYQDVITDQGVSDKRLNVTEEELSQALKMMAREGNILSATIRQAWDSGDLHPLTKNNPIRATGAHISLLGHITKDELLRHLDETEKANGFANRFIWFLVKRSKVIPNPTGTPQENLNPIIERLKAAVFFAQGQGEIKRDSEAEAVWAEVYPKLSEGKPGMVGAVIARAEAQVVRLACIYALLDLSPVVKVCHLKAALALWDYAEASAILIFGDNMGDPVADRIITALKQRGGLSETEIYNLFDRHNSKAVGRALDLLFQAGRIEPETLGDTGGRPKVVWKLCEESELSEKRGLSSLSSLNSQPIEGKA